MMEAGILSWEDRDLFFTDFAIPATLKINAAPGQTPETHEIFGILDMPYERQEFGPVTLDAEDPTFHVKWTDTIATVRKGDYLVVNGETFSIAAAAENDGTGFCDLRLVRGSLQDDAGDTFKTESPETLDGKDYTRPNGILGRR